MCWFSASLPELDQDKVVIGLSCINIWHYGSSGKPARTATNWMSEHEPQAGTERSPALKKIFWAFK
jgi:hypothetical protein